VLVGTADVGADNLEDDAVLTLALLFLTFQLREIDRLDLDFVRSKVNYAAVFHWAPPE
jgi:hypothetical protein